MKARIIALSAASLTAGTLCFAKKQKPNIVYVFPDQCRNAAMGFWRLPEYAGYQGWAGDPTHTPRLNEFAGESVVMSRAVSNCPLSSPYRGIFLTGMYPERSGITLNCMALRPESTLNPEAECISDVLAEAGYSCGYIGKLHAEAPTPNDPDNPGHYVSSRNPEWDAYTPPERRHGYSFWYSYGTFDRHKNPHYWDTEGRRHDPHEFSVKHETDKAIEFLRNENGERKKNAPFFLTVAYNPPHSPYRSLEDCMEEDFAIYKDRSLAELYARANADTSMAKAGSIRYYFANVTAVDREFGRILDELKRLGLEDKTIVVFTSDHGETMCSQGTNDPKNSIWSESFNVPFIIRYPGRLGHKVDSTLLGTADIMPTLLSLAGLGKKIPATAEGMDLSRELLSGEGPVPASQLYIRNVNPPKGEDGLFHGFFPQARGIKTQKWTMEIVIDRKYRVKSVSIFDDIADPYQMNPIAHGSCPEFPSLLEELRTRLREADDIWYRDGIIDKVASQLQKIAL